jgi:riboflavin biosynthesis pyrimidine reductase
VTEPIGFPPPWPDRPWVFAMMVASANGVVAWRRRDRADDPVLAVLGGDRRRPARVADKRLMRVLRCYGDVGVGAETLRTQRELLLSPQQPGDEPAPGLFAFRERAGLSQQPRNLVYSVFGRLPLGHRIFTTPGIEPLVVTTPLGALELERRAAGGPTPPLLVENVLDPAGLRAAHRRLFAEAGIRYLDCEGGMTVLHALRGAGILDEVFVTSTPFLIEEAAHEGVLKIFDFEAEGARLVADGHATVDAGWRFRRWRFSER